MSNLCTALILLIPYEKLAQLKEYFEKNSLLLSVIVSQTRIGRCECILKIDSNK